MKPTKTEKKCGIDCECEKCQKIRDYLFQKELDNKIEIITVERTKRKKNFERKTTFTNNP